MKHLTLIAALILVPLTATAEPVDHREWGYDASTVADIFARCPDQKVPPDVLEIIANMLGASPRFRQGFEAGLRIDMIDIERMGLGQWCAYWEGHYPHLFDPGAPI